MDGITKVSDTTVNITGGTIRKTIAGDYFGLTEKSVLNITSLEIKHGYLGDKYGLIAAANLGETKRSVLQAEDILGLGLTKQIIKVATMPHLIVSDCVPFFAVDPWNQLGDVRALHKGEFE